MASINPPRYSLKTRITLATLAIFLVSLWSLSFYTSRMLHKDMERVLGEQQFATVSMVATQINRELTHRIKSLEIVASQAGEAMQQGPVATQAFLEQHHDLRELFSAGISTVDKRGDRTAYSPYEERRFGVNLMDRDYINTPLKEGKTTIGRPIIGRTEHQPVVVMGAPIRDSDGSIVGVLHGSVIMSRPNYLDQITESRYGKTGGYLLISPAIRRIVTASDKSRAMEELSAPGVSPLLDRFVDGYEGSGVLVDPKGVEKLASAKRVPESGWIVVASLPTSEAFAPIIAMKQRMFIATIVLTLIAGGLCWWLLRRQLSPLLDTAHKLSAMSSSDRPLQPLPIGRNDEIGQLIASFNHLIEIIGKRGSDLQDSHEILNHILGTTKDGFWRTDTKGVLLDVNETYCQLSGFSRAELLKMEIADLEVLFASSEIPKHIKNVVDSGYELFESKHRRKDGTVWNAEISITYCPVDGGILLVFIRDITERKQSEEELQLAATVFSHAREGIVIMAPDGSIIDVNDAFAKITGYDRDDVLGKKPPLLHAGLQDKTFFDAMWVDLVKKGFWNGEVYNRRKNGEIYPELLAISPVRDSKGVIQHFLALFSDITELKEHEKQLEHIAHYDALTKLPNRVLLADRLHQAMAQTQRRGNRLAVAYLDLDGFKEVNDSYGHEVGDQLLIALAGRMSETLREGDTLARMGGDEFTAVLLDLADIESCVPMLNRLLAATAHPIRIGNHVHQVSASLGVAFYPQEDNVDADQLLRQSDQAMYQAKLAGKNRFHFFDAEQDRSVRGHNENLEHIRRALNNNEFELYYQPKVNMRTGQVTGAEALIRWQHPNRGLLAPAVFLPVIESHALAVDVGEWVIHSALTQIENWQREGLDLNVSVNISAYQLQRADFVERVRKTLDEHRNVSAGKLTLEVLETSALEDLAHVSQVIDECHSMGVSFALDDFGTGYSSLSYLKRLPVNKLKIDQSFVRDMLDDPDDLAILEGILGLARAFRRQVIAEGVETVAHGELLLQLGCELAQGYGIARPMPASDIPLWVKEWLPDSNWSSRLPAHRDDLPLLFAGTEHRAWLLALENYLTGVCDTPPKLSYRKCRFGQWLYANGQTRHGSHPSYFLIEDLHRQMHTKAAELCEQYSQRKSPLAGELGKIKSLLDALIDQEKTLLSQTTDGADELARINKSMTDTSILEGQFHSF